MEYFKLSADMERENDIICHVGAGMSLSQNTFVVGRLYTGDCKQLSFTYHEDEGSDATDYLANDKGWFLVSEKLKRLMEGMNTEIQYLPVKIVEETRKTELKGYYIANIIKVVDALCLECSTYFTTHIPQIGEIHTVSKYGIYEKRTQGADVFKLGMWQEIPIFVSEKFKDAMLSHQITGISLYEIKVR